jgi:HK97 family phage prohead protease
VADVIAVGEFLTKLGHARKTVMLEDNRSPIGVREERLIWAMPASKPRPRQAGLIGVNVGHDQSRRVGLLEHLERAPNGSMYAVATIDVDAALPEGPLFWSPEIGASGLFIDGGALTTFPAQICMSEIELAPGRLHDRYERSKMKLTPLHKEIVERAAAQHRQLGDELLIRDVAAERERAKLARWTTAPVYEFAPPSRKLELRAAAAVDIHPARRELDLLIAPAERPTTIYEPGRSYTEVFSHGAFAGAERNPERVRLNRDHVREKLLDKALSLDPWDSEGLPGTVKLSRTRDADEALALIDDGLLGVSAGFGIPRGGDEWRGSHRRVRRAVLDHISVVVEAAYPTAKVLAVRDSRATPNLDQVRVMLADLN